MHGDEYVGYGPLSASVTMQVEAQHEIAAAMFAQMAGDKIGASKYDAAMAKNETAKAIARSYDRDVIRKSRGN